MSAEKKFFSILVVAVVAIAMPMIDFNLLMYAIIGFPVGLFMIFTQA